MTQPTVHNTSVRQTEILRFHRPRSEAERSGKAFSIAKASYNYIFINLGNDSAYCAQY